MGLSFNTTVPVLEQGVLTGARAANLPLWQLRNSSATKRIGLTRLSVTLGDAAITQFSLYYGLTAGTQTGPLNGASVGIATPANHGKVAITWSANPTVTAAESLRTALFPVATAGFSDSVPDFVIWEWPEDDPLIITPTTTVARSSVLLLNSAVAAGVLLIDARWLELP